MKNSSSRLTLANIVSFGFGLAAFAVCFWLGLLFFGMEMNTSLIAALASTLLLGFLLWLLIRAKSTESDVDKWKIVEALVLVVYVLLAAASVWPISRFFSVNSKSELIRKAATTDVRNLQHLMTDFRSTETENLGRTITGMENYVASSASNAPSESVERYFGNPDHKASLNNVGVEIYHDNWQAKIDNFVLGDEVYREAWEARLRDADRNLSRWSLFNVPQSVAALSSLADEMSEQLSKMSHSLPLPIIENRQIVRESQGRDYACPVIKSREVFDGAGSFSIVGILVGLLIHGLILFNYFVTNRSTRVEVTKYGNSNDGGTLLAPTPQI